MTYVDAKTLDGDFYYTEIKKHIAWHKELARDLFVALVGKEGPDCYDDAASLAYLAVDMSITFDDAFDPFELRD